MSQVLDTPAQNKKSTYFIVSLTMSAVIRRSQKISHLLRLHHPQPIPSLHWHSEIEALYLDAVVQIGLQTLAPCRTDKRAIGFRPVHTFDIRAIDIISQLQDPVQITGENQLFLLIGQICLSNLGCSRRNVRERCVRTVNNPLHTHFCLE